MSYSSVVFYIAAHYEDCASFCAQEINAALANPQTKLVFIYVTAGSEGDPDQWWEARVQQETRATASIALPAQPITSYIAQVQGHPIVVYESGSSVTYCLRLLEGNFDGSGAAARTESLSSLRDWKPTHPGDPPCPIHAVDGSTAYRSWQDFCATIAGILTYERLGICQLHPWINVPDYVSACPGGDHADHKAVADAVRSFARSEYYNRAWWQTTCPAAIPADGLVRRRNRFLPYNGDIESVVTFNDPALDERSRPSEKPSRRLVPWYQFDLDTPQASRSCL